MTIWAAAWDKQSGLLKDAKRPRLSMDRRQSMPLTPHSWTRFFTIHLQSETDESTKIQAPRPREDPNSKLQFISVKPLIDEASHQRQRFGRDGAQRQRCAVFARRSAIDAFGAGLSARAGGCQCSQVVCKERNSLRAGKTGYIQKL